ncbi:hypothetical protein CC80DRAFT_175906 [Byssothecium circinans]|uniref:Uncharacterized protein n=1 Tax=Byssothecium circinans TaxID=147558 RepID=A0A6A5TK01_9PLEO|nr:hypothetical protein CC80DRAFT_175906 [Byssothecium circinans]
MHHTCTKVHMCPINLSVVRECDCSRGNANAISINEPVIGCSSGPPVPHAGHLQMPISHFRVSHACEFCGLGEYIGVMAVKGNVGGTGSLANDAGRRWGKRRREERERREEVEVSTSCIRLCSSRVHSNPCNPRPAARREKECHQLPASHCSLAAVRPQPPSQPG